MFGRKRRNQDIEAHIAKSNQRPVAGSAGFPPGTTVTASNSGVAASQPVAQTAGLAKPSQSTIDMRLGHKISHLPEGIIIKRIFTRHSKASNKWRVSYHTRTQEYFAPTLQGALGEFFKNNDDVYERYQRNIHENE